MTTRSVLRIAIVLVAMSTTAVPAAAAAEHRESTGVWERLARCESGGNWHINTGNGYYGGLQFMRGTWEAYGGERYARYPHRASKTEQITVARGLREAHGDYGAWPACARELGLPR
ncbi:transglycosylase family protein [Actinopolyspora halophila]|uniref:transglycosylase family protein n=1 Tax=Actinopolyspora halophila TaxID=1850 RepID=UPI000366F1EC|nr:transglycosylase family protein [Actinopolyspora halophila]